MADTRAPTVKRWHRHQRSARAEISALLDATPSISCGLIAGDHDCICGSSDDGCALLSKTCQSDTSKTCVGSLHGLPPRAPNRSLDADALRFSITPSANSKLLLDIRDAGARHIDTPAVDDVSLQRDRHRWRRKLKNLEEESSVGLPQSSQGQPMLAIFQASSLAQHNRYMSGDNGQEVARAIEDMCQKSKLSLAGPARLLQMPHLARDFASVLEGGAHHLKNIFGSPDDRKLFKQLKAEVEESGLWRSRGGRRDDGYEMTIAPEGGQRTTGRITGEDALTLANLPAHKYVLEHLAGMFDAKPLSWWINVYPSGRDAKNFHKDNFGQNITIGASFGATRNLTFRHGESRDEFHFPQENGDVFAFREGVNSTFLHGMHPLKRTDPDPGVRISVIMMGRARRQT